MTLSIPPVTQASSSPTGASHNRQLASNANSLARESLKEIEQLAASAQAGDSFSLQKIQALAETALSQTNGLPTAGEADLLAEVSDTGYLAQAALKKVGAAQYGITQGGKLHAVA